MKDNAVVLGLNELVPVGRRAPRGCDWWRLERFAKMREDLPDRPRLRDERDQPDVTAARWALERKLLPNPGHQFRPRNPGGVMRAGLLIRGAAASGAVTVAPMPAGRGLAPLADIPDRQRRDGFSQLVVRREYSWLVSRRQAMPVLPRRRDEIGQPVQELKRRELHDAIGSRPRGLPAAAGPDPELGRLDGALLTYRPPSSRGGS